MSIPPSAMVYHVVSPTGGCGSGQDAVETWDGHCRGHGKALPATRPPFRGHCNRREAKARVGGTHQANHWHNRRECQACPSQQTPPCTVRSIPQRRLQLVPGMCRRPVRGTRRCRARAWSERARETGREGETTRVAGGPETTPRSSSTSLAPLRPPNHEREVGARKPPGSKAVCAGDAAGTTRRTPLPGDLGSRLAGSQSET